MVILKECPKCGEIINFIDCYDKLDTTIDTSGGTYEEFYVLNYELHHMHNNILSVEPEQDE